MTSSLTPAAAGLAAGMIFASPALQGGDAAAAAKIQEIASPGGIEAWLVEERSLPIISIDIAFTGGASLDPEGKEGLATLLTNMLDEGAGDLDSAGFALRKDEIAARIGFNTGRDTVTASLTMLRDRRTESVELFRLALNEPRFDQPALDKVKNQIRSLIRQDESSPQKLASKALVRAMFPNDPYGRQRLGTLESVDGLTAEDLRGALPKLLNRSRMKVGVVGAVSADEAGAMLDVLLGGLSGEPFASLDPTRPAAEGEVEVVDFDAPQSTVVFGHIGIARDDPDFIPAYVMNYILGGGGFSSRLTEEVREKRGLAYSVYSYLLPMDRSALYLGGVSTANERVSETIKVIREEWGRMAEQGPTEEELDAAKRYLTGAFALRFDSNAKIAGFLVRSQLDKLGVDYIDRRNDLVEAVTIEDVRRVAARLLKPEALYFAVVGKPEGL